MSVREHFSLLPYLVESVGPVLHTAGELGNLLRTDYQGRRLGGPDTAPLRLWAPSRARVGGITKDPQRDQKVARCPSVENPVNQCIWLQVWSVNPFV